MKRQLHLNNWRVNRILANATGNTSGMNRKTRILRTLHELNKQSDVMGAERTPAGEHVKYRFDHDHLSPMERSLSDLVRLLSWKPYHISTIRVTPEQADSFEQFIRLLRERAREEHDAWMRRLEEAL